MHFNLFQLDTKSPALLEKLGHQAKKSLAGTNAQSFPIKCPVFFDHTKGFRQAVPLDAWSRAQKVPEMAGPWGVTGQLC